MRKSSKPHLRQDMGAGGDAGIAAALVEVTPPTSGL